MIDEVAELKDVTFGSADGGLEPRRREGVLVCRVADELVLYDSQSEVAVALNVSAAAIWELCDGTRTVASIVDELSLPLESDPQSIGLDVDRVLRELSSLHLLVAGEG